MSKISFKFPRGQRVNPSGAETGIFWKNYCKTSNISRILIGNKIIDNSDVVGALPVCAAPTTSSFSTWHLASMDWAKTTAKGDKKHLSFGSWCDLYWRFNGRSITWSGLMHCLLTLLCHQQEWFWWCRVNRVLVLHNDWFQVPVPS